MVECPKCGGEMREGRAFVEIVNPGIQNAPSFPGLGGMTGFPGMGMGTVTDLTTTKVMIQWWEKTGRKTGLILKSDEEKTMKISGLRCIKCGFVEFYVKE